MELYECPLGKEVEEAKRVLGMLGTGANKPPSFLVFSFLFSISTWTKVPIPRIRHQEVDDSPTTLLVQ